MGHSLVSRPLHSARRAIRAQQVSTTPVAHRTFRRSSAATLAAHHAQRDTCTARARGHARRRIGCLPRAQYHKTHLARSVGTSCRAELRERRGVCSQRHARKARTRHARTQIEHGCLTGSRIGRAQPYDRRKRGVRHRVRCGFAGHARGQRGTAVVSVQRSDLRPCVSAWCS